MAPDPHRDPALLHALLRQTLTRARGAGLPVYLVAGHRSVDWQIRLWRARIADAVKVGDKTAPPSWEAVEADFARWWPWVNNEMRGRHTSSKGWWSRKFGSTKRPPLLLPGLSSHQGMPAIAMDLGVSDRNADKHDILAQVMEFAPPGVYRPLDSEPWHFEVRRTHY